MKQSQPSSSTMMTSVSPWHKQRWKQVWKSKIPPKIRVFVWRAVHNALPTKENLTPGPASLGVISPSVEHDISNRTGTVPLDTTNSKTAGRSGCGQVLCRLLGSVDKSEQGSDGREAPTADGHYQESHTAIRGIHKRRILIFPQHLGRRSDLPLQSKFSVIDKTAISVLNCCSLIGVEEMDKLARGYRAKNGGYRVNELNGVGVGLNSQTLLIIKLPDSRALSIISRSLFLAMVLLALPSLGSMIRSASNVPLFGPDADLGFADGFDVLPILLRDLVEEGLIKKGHKGFVLATSMPETEDDFEFLRDAGVDLLTGADLRRKKLGEHQLIDGVLKDGGLVISPLGPDPVHELRLLRNFKIVYLRRFENTVIAMRKVGASLNSMVNSARKQAFCGVTPEKKRAALKGLEDVYLEPPRQTAMVQSSREIKFLPELLKYSLEDYPRRIFISDDLSALDWFYKNYPTGNQEFEVYNMEVEIANKNRLSRRVESQETAVSNWITKKVRPEDYVVMKAEAETVEEMLKDKTLCLVDELFLECKNQWQDGEDGTGSKRAYWQCLTLYGKVKDLGIAVHQWWY
ncbi:hypothetical protein Salat_0145400 [Sesamum alatum]|uniref:Reverse transcriptase zinc-binding domain-containing protein n=1 Tax=Sesamum alatum TaxID=300844 RepID=A0AAE1YY24_9LAMI|nr:hypothetical protein Salat_0145400 [Sesamum alatum]